MDIVGYLWISLDILGYPNGANSQMLFEGQIVLVASIWTVQVMDMMIIGDCYACANDMSDMSIP